jgi:transposase-like protein
LVDAIVIKIREDGRVRPHSVLIAIGINELGHREILGMQIGNSETEASWTEFFNTLKARGLSRVDLIVSDDHGGLVQAIQTCFQGVAWQRCQTHFTKNILDACPKKLQAQIKGRLRTVFEASDIETSRKLTRDIADESLKKHLRQWKLLKVVSMMLLQF